MDDKAEKVALFRYGLIAPLVLETLPRGELTRRAQQIAARLCDIPHSTRRQVSVDTLLDSAMTALTAASYRNDQSRCYRERVRSRKPPEPEAVDKAARVIAKNFFRGLLRPARLPREIRARAAMQAARDYAKGQTSPGKAPSPVRSRAIEAALQREGTQAASHTALSRQAQIIAKKRGAADLSRAAEKAVATKGQAGLKSAARKAARTRAAGG